MRPKVLMVGPGEGVVGGIATVVATLKPILGREIDLSYVPMTSNRLQKTTAGKVTTRNIVAVVRQYLVFLRAILFRRPDVVHLHTSEGSAWFKDTYYVLLSRLLRIPVVLHVHAADMDRLFAQRPAYEQRYTRYVMNRASVVIAVSEQWRQRLSTIIPANKIVTLRNCVDVGALEPANARATNGEANILFLGSVGPRKGLYDLIEAAKTLDAHGCSFKMWLLGYEESAGELERARNRIAAAELQDVCLLHGVVTGNDKDQMLRTADIFTLPSYNEGLPIAVLEAMAAGLPVVASPVGGIPEVVHDGENGYLVQPGDVEALAEKLALLTSDDVLRRQMGQYNRQIAEQELDVKQYITRLVRLYQMLLR